MSGKRVEYRIDHVCDEDCEKLANPLLENGNAETYKLFFEKVEAEGIQPAFQINGMDAFLYADNLYISFVKGVNLSFQAICAELSQAQITIEQMIFLTRRPPSEDNVYVLYTVTKDIETQSVRVQTTDFPIDKVNGTVWGLLENAIKRTEDGQMSLIPVEKAGSKTPVFVQYAISFDDLENTPGLTLTRKLSRYERRVYIAAGALWNIKGQQPFTYSELYAAAGYIGRPGGNDLDKLATALTKMNGAKIYVDNVNESDSYNYPHFRYDGQLLPMERVSIVENGKPIEAAIHLLREPPLISYAREHKQITRISVRLLQSPLSKTDANIMLEDYFIERITRAKNDRQKLEKKRCHTQEERDEKEKALKKDLRILLSTVYDKAQINTTKQRQRATDKIIKLLDHYKTEKFFSNYSIDDTGITIVL